MVCAEVSGTLWSEGRIRLFAHSVFYCIIIIMQTYLKALNIQNACQEYSVECMSTIKSIYVFSLPISF